MVAPKPSAKPAIAARPAKTFSVQPWAGSSEGQKIVVYGKSGIGKTSLAITAPGAVFIGLDDGARRFKHPVTGADINAIPGVEDFQDLRDAVHQSVKLIPDKGTLVLDTITMAEEFASRWVLQNVKTEKGSMAANLLAYGWGGGFRHVDDHMRLLLSDFDPLIRSGRNVVLLAQLAQARISNSEGSDFLEDGPQLYHSNTLSTRTGVCAWADHVLRIGYQDVQVVKENLQARAGKVTGDQTRVIYTGGALHYVAKTRPIDGKRLPAVISFETEADDSLWQMIFGGAIP